MMIENLRNNMIWARFMKNADVQRGLALAGFLPVGGRRAQGGARRVRSAAFFGASPNPFVEAPRCATA